MSDELDQIVLDAVGRFGLVAVLRVVDGVGGSGGDFRARRIAARVPAVQLAAAVARGAGRSVASVSVAISAWERHGAAPARELRAALVEALAAAERDAAEEAPGAAAHDREEGAELLARWRDLDIPVARWGERASVDACVSPRSAVAAIYAWASGRGAPAPRLRAALVAALEAAEAIQPVAPPRAWDPPPVAAPPPPPPAADGPTFADFLAGRIPIPTSASTDIGSGVGKGGRGRE